MKFNSCIFTAFCFVELYSYFRLGQIINLLIRLTDDGSDCRSDLARTRTGLSMRQNGSFPHFARIGLRLASPCVDRLATIGSNRPGRPVGRLVSVWASSGLSSCLLRRLYSRFALLIDHHLHSSRSACQPHYSESAKALQDGAKALQTLPIA